MWQCKDIIKTLVPPLNLIQFNHSVVSDSLQPHESRPARPPCPLPTPRVYSNSCLLSRSNCLILCRPFSSYLQCFPASGSLPMSQLFTSGSQSIGASASVLPVNIQGWFSLGLTDLISLLSKGLSSVFSSTTIWKHQFFSAQTSDAGEDPGGFLGQQGDQTNQS